MHPSGVAVAPDVARPQAIAARRALLKRSLSGRFWLRFHAALIAGATFATGFLASLGLLALGMEAVLPRWLIAIALAYGACFVLVRFWLAYIGARRWRRAQEVADATGDVPIGGGGGSARAGRSVDAAFEGEGGHFGGAGASADFEGAASHALSAKDGGSFLGDVAVEAGEGLGVVVVIGLIVLAVVIALAGGAIHFLWIAPELLIDAAFAALLTSGAVPGLKRIDEPDWDGRLLRATWAPLALVVLVASMVALALGYFFPEARTLGEAWRSLR